MQDLILYIVKSLVTNPDAVSVEEQRDGGEVNLLLTVDPADMGLVIGKGGQTIKSIRKVLIVKAMADNVRVNLQLAEPAGGYKKPEEAVSPPVETVEEGLIKEATPANPKKSKKAKKEVGALEEVPAVDSAEKTPAAVESIEKDHKETTP